MQGRVRLRGVLVAGLAFAVATVALGSESASFPDPAPALRGDSACERLPNPLKCDTTPRSVDTMTRAVALGSITVYADPEDLPAPSKDKWTRFADTITGASHFIEGRYADGTRFSCRTPCVVNCCVGPNQPFLGLQISF